ncbi:MAG: hypothetical protein NT02SARS_1601 [SAR86 cluster bacterium SAR86B]|uniref:Uncharacterized protein n=1 Tax=SAR86 cluster bacterium SAR86B TaxID=1123867 RepID=J5KLR0_9GAMM|nr:MAG: hypothetical protein NT02SARS_1601 [SAR86 cluster bacterium SAR86B]
MFNSSYNAFFSSLLRIVNSGTRSCSNTLNISRLIEYTLTK